MNAFEKLAHHNKATILLVGAEGTGKHSLAKALINEDTPYELQVRTASKFPLPEGDRPKIDFIVFLVDLLSKHSLTTIENTLGHIDVHYFHGKSCVIAKYDNSMMECSVETELVTTLANSISSPVYWMDKQDKSSEEETSKQLLQLLSFAAGFKPNVSSILLNTA